MLQCKEEEDSMTERRSYERSTYLNPLTIVSGKEKTLAVAMNISRGGLGVLSDKPISKGPCEIQIQNQKLKGVVVFQQRHEKGVVKTDSPVFQSGIKFTQPIQGDYLQLLLKQSPGK